MRRHLIVLVAAGAALGCGARSQLPVPDVVHDTAEEAPADAALEANCAPAVTLLAAGSDVALVLDRSFSMTSLLPGGVSRWDALGMALARTLPPIDGSIGIGALFFPLAGMGNVTCASANSLDVPIGLGHAAAVLQTFAAHEPNGGTPTADALRVAFAALRARMGNGASKNMVLATDGGPNCNPADAGQPWYGVAPEFCAMAGFDPHVCLDDTRTIDVLNEALAADVPTYVIGMAVTDPLLVDTLNRMAIAGGRPRAGATSFYDVQRPDELQDAFADIASHVASCTFVPTTAIDYSGGSVMIDGDVIPRDDTRTTGWSPDPSGAIDLAGTACERAHVQGASVVFQPHCH